MFAVVEQQEQVLVAQKVGQGGDRRLPRPDLDRQRPDDLIDHETGLTQRGELDQPCAVAVAPGSLTGHMEHQAGLAGAADADQRHESVPVKQPANLGHFPLAAHERGHLGRKVGRREPRAQWGKFRREARRGQLEQALWLVEVLETMLAQVHERMGGRVVEKQVVGGLGNEDLAAMPHGADPGRPVDADADVAVARGRRLGGMDGHPDPDRRSLRPALLRQRPLGIDGRADRIARPLERHEERVALRVDLVAVVDADRRADQLLVETEQLAVAIGPDRAQDAGRALDVGEQEGDRAAGSIVHDAVRIRASIAPDGGSGVATSPIRRSRADSVRSGRRGEWRSGRRRGWRGVESGLPDGA